MRSPPEVSVIVPVYNGEQTIERALDSIFAQSFRDFEVIVVDDASTDRTVSLIEAYEDDRLSLLRSAENKGAGAARNKGIAVATGRRIAFLDSDDAWKPAKLARQVELLDRSSRPVAACATGYNIDKNGRLLAVELNLTPQRFQRDIVFGCTISPGSTLMVDREVFSEIGGFDERFRRLEDWDWLLRFSERFDMEFVAEPLAEIYQTWKEPPPAAGTGDPTLDGIRRMSMKHSAGLSSLRKRLQFKGSLLIEQAAVLYRNGNQAAAIFYVMMGLAVFPARNLAFFKTLWRAVRERIGR